MSGNLLFSRLFAAWALLVALFALPATAQEHEGKQITKVALIADSTAIVPGKEFSIGIHMRIEPGWHTYWQHAGDLGDPIAVRWELPEGFMVDSLQWPLPESYLAEETFLNYVYHDEVLLIAKVIAPNEISGEVQLKAHVSWQVCEKICIPAEQDVTLTLPVAPSAQPANAELFAKFRAQLPQEGEPPFKLKWTRAQDRFSLALADVPKDVKLEFFRLSPEGEIKQDRPELKGPTEEGTAQISVAVAPIAWRGLLVATQPDGKRLGWTVEAPTESAEGETTGIPEPAASADSIPASTGNSAPTGILFILFSAFVGGLILNVMPCVLPVIALKIFGFMNQAGEHPERIFRLGLAFCSGVLTFFLALATLTIALRSAGSSLTWGFQFQNPLLLIGLAGIVLIFALAMFGVFEITLGSDTATKLDALSHKEGYGGAFIHGFFTTLLGTSCTAPFLGPVLGLTISQPPLMIFVIFTVIALGMALPYLLLTWKPAWMRYLPKPGVWMERVKQFMGFIVLGVVAWLMAVLARSWGAEAVGAGLWFLAVLGLACWLFGLFRRRAIAWTVAILLVGGGWLFFVHGELNASEPVTTEGNAPVHKGKIAWERFSDERLSQALSEGNAVFVDFTAEWCLNCKTNERFVIETDPIATAFKDKSVVALQADFTRKDPHIKEWLAKFGRVGVPLYVVYPGGSKPPIVLPEIITQQMILDALAKVESP